MCLVIFDEIKLKFSFCTITKVKVITGITMYFYISTFNHKWMWKIRVYCTINCCSNFVRPSVPIQLTLCEKKSCFLRIKMLLNIMRSRPTFEVCACDRHPLRKEEGSGTVAAVKATKQQTVLSQKTPCLAQATFCDSCCMARSTRRFRAQTG